MLEIIVLELLLRTEGTVTWNCFVSRESLQE